MTYTSGDSFDDVHGIFPRLGHVFCVFCTVFTVIIQEYPGNSVRVNE